MHHSRGNYNYSLYFNVWDRLCGTNHAEYEKTFNEVTARRAAGRRKPSDAQTPQGAHAGA
jgi:sterol desaturase/sphingolipid hydroxylase (fatty acid hydroxylase superfamily)